MEKMRLNPNSLKRLRRDSSTSWSELPRDLLSSVFERLSFVDFQRAKSVCSSWHSASRQSVPKNNEIPWLILFPEENKDNNKDSYSCTLFNPDEKERLYKTQDMGLEFAKSVCRATYGNWLLMQDPCYNPYIVNLFNKERINLPPVESQLGMVKVERTKDDEFRTTYPTGYEDKGIIIMRCPVFWIDEKTKDYIVIWALGSFAMDYSRKVDSLWKQIPEHSCCRDMVYKDHKLYFLSYCGGWFNIFDFSGEIPQIIFHCEPYCQLGDSWSLFASKLVVTVTGEVLKVERLRRRRMTLGVSEIELRSKPWSFRVIKVYSPESQDQRIHSLGDESLLVDQGITDLDDDVSMILDQGITKLANDIDGFIRNSIYFSGTYDKNTVDVFLFNVKTRKTESLHQFDCSSVQFSGARWFLPSFIHT